MNIKNSILGEAQQVASFGNAVDSIKNIAAVDGETLSYEKLAAAVSHLGIEEQKRALAKAGMNKEDAESVVAINAQILAKNEEAASTVLVSKAQQEQLLTEGTLTEEKWQEIAATIGLEGAENGALVTKKKLVKGEVEQILAEKGVVGEEQKHILSLLGLDVAETTTITTTDLLTASFKRLWTSILANPLAWVVAGFAAATYSIYKLSKANDELKSKAQSLGQSYVGAKKNITDYKVEIESLYETINDESSSIEESEAARSRLLETQQALISTYGEEAGAVDLITSAINGEVDALDELIARKYQQAVNDFNSNSGWDGFWTNASNSLLGYSDNMDRMVKTMQSYDADLGNLFETINISDSKQLEDTKDFISKVRKEYGDLIESVDGQIHLVGNAEDVQDAILGIQKIASEYDNLGDNISKSLTSSINEVNDTVSKYSDMWNSYVLNDEILSNDTYKEDFKQINEAYKNYQEAFKSGSTEQIKLTTTEFIKAFNQAIEDSNGDDDVLNYFQDMYPELQAEVNSWNFKVGFEFDDSLHSAIASLQAGGYYTSKDILGINNVDELGDNAQKSAYTMIDNIAKQWHVSIDEIMDYAVEKGMISSGEIATSFSNISTKSEFNSEDFTKDTESLEKLQSLYKNYQTALKKGITLSEALDISDIEGLGDEWKKYSKEFKALEKVLGTVGSSSKDCQKAFDDLATAYANDSVDVRSIAADNKDLVASQLELHGITKDSAKEFTEYYSELNSWEDNIESLIAIQQKEIKQEYELDAARIRKTQSGQEAGKALTDLANDTQAEIDKIELEIPALQNATNAQKAYYLSKKVAEFDFTSGDIEQLNLIVQSLGVGISAWNAYYAAAENRKALEQGKAVQISEATARAAAQAGISAREQYANELDASTQSSFENFSKQLTDLYTKSVDTTAITDAASGAGKDAGDAYADAYKKELEQLESDRDNHLITEKEFLDKWKALIQKFYGDVSKYPKEYAAEMQKYNKGVLDYMNNVGSAVVGLIDRKISQTQKARDNAIKALENEKKNALKPIEDRIKAIEKEEKALNKEIKGYEKEKKAIDKLIEGLNDQIKAKEKVVKSIEKEIKELEKRKEPYEDEIEHINDVADARERDINLQKAQYELERQQAQRTRLVYSDERGFHYENDPQGIRDAKEQVDEATREKEIAEIQKLIDAIDSEIEIKNKSIEGIQEEIDLLNEQIAVYEEQKELIDKKIEAVQEQLDLLAEEKEALEEEKAAIEEYYDELIKETEEYFDAILEGLEETKSKWEELMTLETISKNFGLIKDFFKDTEFSVSDILNGDMGALDYFADKYVSTLNEIYSNDQGTLEGLKKYAQEYGISLEEAAKKWKDVVDVYSNVDPTAAEELANDIEKSGTAASTAQSSVSNFANSINDVATNSANIQTSDLASQLKELEGIGANAGAGIESIANGLGNLKEKFGESEGLGESIQSVANSLIGEDGEGGIVGALNDLSDVESFNIQPLVDSFNELKTAANDLVNSLGGNKAGADINGIMQGTNVLVGTPAGDGIQGIIAALEKISRMSLSDSDLLNSFKQLSDCIKKIDDALSGGEDTEGIVTSLENLEDVDLSELVIQFENLQNAITGENGISKAIDAVKESISGQDGLINALNQLNGDGIDFGDEDSGTGIIGKFGLLKKSIEDTSSALGFSGEDDSESGQSSKGSNSGSSGSLKASLDGLNAYSLSGGSEGEESSEEGEEGGIIGQFVKLKDSVVDVTNAIDGSGGMTSGESEGETEGGGTLVEAMQNMQDLGLKNTKELIGEGDPGSGEGTGFKGIDAIVNKTGDDIGSSVDEETDETLIGSVNLFKSATDTAVPAIKDLFDELKDTLAEIAAMINEIIAGLNSIGGASLPSGIGVPKYNGTVGDAFATGTVGEAFAKGSRYNGLDKTTDALTSEFGQPELIVTPDGNVQLTTEPTFQRLPKDTVIFNGEQTERILKGKTKGHAFASGTLPQGFSPLTSDESTQFNLLNSVNDIASKVEFANAKLMNMDKNVATIVNKSTNINNAPVINVTNPQFTCTGVTGEQVLREIEQSFSGLFINAYQKTMSR